MECLTRSDGRTPEADVEAQRRGSTSCQPDASPLFHDLLFHWLPELNLPTKGNRRALSLAQENGAEITDKLTPDVTHIVVGTETSWSAVVDALGGRQPSCRVFVVRQSFILSSLHQGRVDHPPAESCLVTNTHRTHADSQKRRHDGTHQGQAGRESKRRRSATMAQVEATVSPEYPRPGESDEDFLARVVPSKALAAPDSVIRVVSPGYNAEPGDEVSEFKSYGEAVLQQWQAFKNAFDSEEEFDLDNASADLRRFFRKRARNLEDQLLTRARELGVRRGRWLLFIKEDVDSAWKRAARATLAGELGCCTEIRELADARSGSSVHLLSIYTTNFDDAQDVKRVYDCISALGLTLLTIRPSLTYKCELYSYLGIRSDNEAMIKVTHYDSGTIHKAARRQEVRDRETNTTN